jgi:hypothetical protein
MSSSSPSDLAIAFRSIPRRLREARGGASADSVFGIDRELDEQIELAARLMHASRDPEKIADAIHDVPPDAWDADTLNSLRTIALDIGRLLRAMAAVTDGNDDDDD